MLLYAIIIMSIIYALLKHSNFTNSLDNCRAARVSQANDRVLFEIKYVHTLRKQMLQLRKLDGCTLRRMVYSSAATQQALQLFPLLCGVSSAGGLQPVDFDVGGAIPPPLCCALV